LRKKGTKGNSRWGAAHVLKTEEGFRAVPGPNKGYAGKPRWQQEALSVVAKRPGGECCFSPSMASSYNFGPGRRSSQRNESPCATAGPRDWAQKRLCGNFAGGVELAALSSGSHIRGGKKEEPQGGRLDNLRFRS